MIDTHLRERVGDALDLTCVHETRYVHQIEWGRCVENLDDWWFLAWLRSASWYGKQRMTANWICVLLYKDRKAGHVCKDSFAQCWRNTYYWSNTLVGYILVDEVMNLSSISWKACMCLAYLDNNVFFSLHQYWHFSSVNLSTLYHGILSWFVGRRHLMVSVNTCMYMVMFSLGVYLTKCMMHELFNWVDVWVI